MPVQVVPLAARHTEQVAELHLAHLPTSFRGTSGTRLLRLYYRVVAAGAGSTGYVAEHNARVAGYMCAVWDARAAHLRLLRDSWPGLVFWASVGTIRHPWLLTSWLQRLRPTAPPDVQTPPPDDRSCELRPLVVAPSMRGHGVASDLEHALTSDLWCRGFTRLYFYTATDNAVVHRMFGRRGYQRVAELDYYGTPHYRYELRAEDER